MRGRQHDHVPLQHGPKTVLQCGKRGTARGQGLEQKFRVCPQPLARQVQLRCELRFCAFKRTGAAQLSGAHQRRFLFDDGGQFLDERGEIVERALGFSLRGDGIHDVVNPSACTFPVPCLAMPCCLSSVS